MVIQPEYKGYRFSARFIVYGCWSFSVQRPVARGGGFIESPNTYADEASAYEAFKRYVDFNSR